MIKIEMMTDTVLLKRYLEVVKAEALLQEAQSLLAKGDDMTVGDIKRLKVISQALEEWRDTRPG